MYRGASGRLGGKVSAQEEARCHREILQGHSLRHNLICEEKVLKLDLVDGGNERLKDCLEEPNARTLVLVVGAVDHDRGGVQKGPSEQDEECERHCFTL